MRISEPLSKANPQANSSNVFPAGYSILECQCSDVI